MSNLPDNRRFINSKSVHTTQILTLSENGENAIFRKQRPSILSDRGNGSSKQRTREDCMRQSGQVADKSGHNRHVDFNMQTIADEKVKDSQGNAKCYLCER